MSTVVKATHRRRTEKLGLAMWGLWETFTKGGFGTEVEMEDRLERGEDLIIGRNKEVLVSNIMLNKFNRKM